MADLPRSGELNQERLVFGTARCQFRWERMGFHYLRLWNDGVYARRFGHRGKRYEKDSFMTYLMTQNRPENLSRSIDSAALI